MRSKIRSIQALSVAALLVVGAFACRGGGANAEDATPIVVEEDGPIAPGESLPATASPQEEVQVVDEQPAPRRAEPAPQRPEPVTPARVTPEGHQIPEWMKVDRAARLVQMDILVGGTDFNNHWNFNGFAKGNATITVPQGYKVVIRFRNGDPSFPHSLAIGQPMEQYPPLFENPSPVFPGAVTSNATSLTESTKPGKGETISFTASRPGDFVMLCYVPAHAIAGMWIHFRVSAKGEVGFEGPTT